MTLPPLGGALARPLSLIKETKTDDYDGRSLALVGGAFRLLRCRLKRAAPTDARGRCPQKNKITISLI
ncbi:MAG: hypothetical protein MPL62_13290, partial [Alphaproteobacteria bacterium]|nr:hypothetical protein [Alphaproteobacteria bacterium]